MRQRDEECSNRSIHLSTNEGLDGGAGGSDRGLSGRPGRTGGLGGPGDGGDSRRAFEAPTAFSAAFLDQLGRRERHPATPEADGAGPWRVMRLHGAATSWACLAAGEAAPRARLAEPDLAYLTAAALAGSGWPERFRLQEDAAGTIHLISAQGGTGRALGMLSGWHGDLPAALTLLDLLRCQPLALAHFLLAVSDDALARTGRILFELSEGRGGA